MAVLGITTRSRHHPPVATTISSRPKSTTMMMPTMMMRVVVYDGPRMDASVRHLEFYPRSGSGKGCGACHYLAVASESGNAPLSALSTVTSESTILKQHLVESRVWMSTTGVAASDVLPTPPTHVAMAVTMTVG